MRIRKKLKRPDGSKKGKVGAEGRGTKEGVAACPNNRSGCRLAAGLVTPKVLTAKQVFYLKMVPSICLLLSDLSNYIIMNSVPI